MNKLSKEINIKIHSLGFGDYDTFRVNPYITVEDLKKLVCQKNDFPLTTIRLLFKGKSLISSSSINDYGITNDDMLYAVPAPRIPPQYLPISFNITIQSNDPVVYHYRPDTRDFDRQINTMRVKIAEIQEACSSALLRISLTQHLLTRRDNPKSVKIPIAIVPSPSSIRNPQESEQSNSAVSDKNAPYPSINTIDLSLLSNEERMKRYEHGCRIVQGKLLEALKAITTNVTSLKQYKVMENHGEMGAIFTREGPLPEPPVLTRDLLITNATSGLGELFGAPGSNLVPHTIFHFPDDPNENNSQNNRSNRNERNHGNRNDQHSNDEIISPTPSQLFPSHMSQPIPSEITNSVVQQAHSQISLKPENQIKNNKSRRRLDGIFDRQHRHRRRRSNRSISHHRIFDLDEPPDFLPFQLNSDSDNDSSESDNSDHFNSSNGNEANNTNKRKKKRNSRPSPLDELINDDNDSNPLSNFIRMHRDRIRRMRANLDSNSNSDDNNNSYQMSFLDNLLNSLNDDNSNNNNDDDDTKSDSKTNHINEPNDNNNNSHSEYPRFFTQEEIDQLNNDKKMIEESAENGTIPSLNPEYYQTRILEGY